jgi:hypothetical protein
LIEKIEKEKTEAKKRRHEKLITQLDNSAKKYISEREDLRQSD